MKARLGRASVPGARVPGDEGSAVVEFLGVVVLLMIPAFYLLFTLARVQAAVFATQGAAQDAGRVLSMADSYDLGLVRAEAAVGVALADQGFAGHDAGEALTVDCSSVVCLAPGSEVLTTVRIGVTFPGLGGLGVPAEIPVSASVLTPVDRFKVGPS